MREITFIRPKNIRRAQKDISRDSEYEDPDISGNSARVANIPTAGETFQLPE